MRSSDGRRAGEGREGQIDRYTIGEEGNGDGRKRVKLWEKVTGRGCQEGKKRVGYKEKEKGEAY